MDACSSVARSRPCRRGSPVPASSRLRTRSAGGSLHDCRRSSRPATPSPWSRSSQDTPTRTPSHRATRHAPPYC